MPGVPRGLRLLAVRLDLGEPPTARLLGLRIEQHAGIRARRERQARRSLRAARGDHGGGQHRPGPRDDVRQVVQDGPAGRVRQQDGGQPRAGAAPPSTTVPNRPKS